MKTKNLLEILATPSPSGWEKDGQRLWIKNVTPHANRVESDPHGNGWAVLEGADAKAPINKVWLWGQSRVLTHF